ncbi:MAG: hypothetical protein EBV06_07875 [Planctomycetia bacterium]|nr:hypothetical protein [Planctomycetia bacterium]
MKSTTTRILTALIAVASILAVVMVVCPQALTGMPARDSAVRMMELVSEPSEQNEIVRRRIMVKTEIIARLIEGELSLFQAAARFRTINAQPMGIEDISWQRLNGIDDGEKLCRQVLSWVRFQGDTSARHHSRQHLIEQLESELNQHILAHGGVRLDIF